MNSYRGNYARLVLCGVPRVRESARQRTRAFTVFISKEKKKRNEKCSGDEFDRRRRRRRRGETAASDEILSRTSDLLDARRHTCHLVRGDDSHFCDRLLRPYRAAVAVEMDLVSPTFHIVCKRSAVMQAASLVGI